MSTPMNCNKIMPGLFSAALIVRCWYCSSSDSKRDFVPFPSPLPTPPRCSYFFPLFTLCFPSTMTSKLYFCPTTTNTIILFSLLTLLNQTRYLETQLLLGGRFWKVPIINGPGKLSPFTLKIEVSIVLHLTW